MRLSPVINVLSRVRFQYYIMLLYMHNIILTLNLINGRREGPNMWRDQVPPVDILNDWIKRSSFPEAEWAPDGSCVTINGHKHSLKESGKAVVNTIIP